jgi:hypothetical protein
VAPVSKEPSAIDSWCTGKDWRWRAVLLVLLVWQAVRPLRDPDAWHIFRGITFGVHEFGHLLFALSGNEWITIAGGSGLQLLLPIAAMAAVAKTSGDWFGTAAVGTWLAASFADLSPYIADARAQELDLVSFSEDGAGHDWHYLLAQAGMLKQDLAVARFSNLLAGLVIFCVVVFSLYLFVRMASLKAPAEDAARA